MPRCAPAIRPADWVTLMRLAAVPPLVWFVAREAWWPAAVTVALAVATDWYDGRLARRGDPASYGALLDHGADACFVVAGLSALAAAGRVTPWLAPLVALAFAQYAFDSRAHRGEPLRGSAIGRANGIAYYVLLALTIAYEACSMSWPSASWTVTASGVLALTTLASMAERALHVARLRSD